MRRGGPWRRSESDVEQSSQGPLAVVGLVRVEPPRQTVLQLRLALLYVEPEVWRRLLVPGGVRLHRLHEMFQAGMGWTDSHLHNFRIGDELYGMQFDDYADEELDETTVTVTGTVGKIDRFFYDYDFGDGWEHEIVVEETTSFPFGLKYAVCLEGARACPPENVGGPPGYEEFRKVISDPSHRDFERITAWSGGSFDPAVFSLAECNIALQRLSSRSQ